MVVLDRVKLDQRFAILCSFSLEDGSTMALYVHHTIQFISTFEKGGRTSKNVSLLREFSPWLGIFESSDEN